MAVSIQEILVILESVARKMGLRLALILSSLLQPRAVSIARTANDLYTKEMKLIVVVDQILDEEIKVHLENWG